MTSPSRFNDDPSQFNEEMLSAYLDNELSPELRSVVERRVAEDPSTQKLLEELRGIRNAVRDLPEWEGNEITVSIPAARIGLPEQTELDRVEDLFDQTSKSSDRSGVRSSTADAVVDFTAESEKPETSAGLMTTNENGDPGLNRGGEAPEGSSDQESERSEENYSTRSVVTAFTSNRKLLRPLTIAASLLAVLGLGYGLWNLAPPGFRFVEESDSLAARNLSRRKSPMSPAAGGDSVESPRQDVQGADTAANRSAEYRQPEVKPEPQPMRPDRLQFSAGSAGDPQLPASSDLAEHVAAMEPSESPPQSQAQDDPEAEVVDAFSSAPLELAEGGGRSNEVPEQEEIDFPRLDSKMMDQGQEIEPIPLDGVQPIASPIYVASTASWNDQAVVPGLLQAAKLFGRQITVHPLKSPGIALADLPTEKASNTRNAAHEPALDNAAAVSAAENSATEALVESRPILIADIDARTAGDRLAEILRQLPTLQPAPVYADWRTDRRGSSLPSVKGESDMERNGAAVLSPRGAGRRPENAIAGSESPETPPHLIALFVSRREALAIVESLEPRNTTWFGNTDRSSGDAVLSEPVVLLLNSVPR